MKLIIENNVFPSSRIGLKILHCYAKNDYYALVLSASFELQFTFTVILSPLRPVSLTCKNHQRREIIHGMRPVEHKD